MQTQIMMHYMIWVLSSTLSFHAAFFVHQASLEMLEVLVISRSILCDEKSPKLNHFMPPIQGGLALWASNDK